MDAGRLDRTGSALATGLGTRDTNEGLVAIHAWAIDEVIIKSH
jgi:hypothetical protein